MSIRVPIPQLLRYVFAANAIAFLFIPLVLWMLPADFFDHGPVTCPSVLYYGEECSGCGLTRATMYLLHGDWLEAYYYNGLVFVTTPVLTLLWGFFIGKCLQLSKFLPQVKYLIINK
ncbi:MAG: DUF2752 domain-containing protein [Chitinophagales bacterium]|nr:DUF2752 domain-containing protein [Chitinophagales bacterium]